MSQVYLLHENDAWTEPLRGELRHLSVPYQDWFLDRGQVRLDQRPPDGVFYNRMSASSHTRDHRFAGELTAGVLAWLETHKRRVLNNTRALQLELSKTAQYLSLEAHGIRAPRTVTTVGKEEALAASRLFRDRFITKHNRGGKGLGVRLFESKSAFEAYLYSESYEAPIDGVLLLQEYIESPDASIIRTEFIGGRFVYAVRVDTSEGFELCPADPCVSAPSSKSPKGESRSLGESNCPANGRDRFEILPNFDHPLLASIPGFLDSNGIEVAALEMIFDSSGNAFVYDVNTNTNYNRAAEKNAGKNAMRVLAEFLRQELAEVDGVSSRSVQSRFATA